MRRVQGRVVAVLAVWLAAFGLVGTGAVIPAAAAEGENSTTTVGARTLVPETVRVTTAGMPERGRLVLETKTPGYTDWRSWSSVDWILSTSEHGVQRMKIPTRFIRMADDYSAYFSLRIKYIPSDTSHVATVASAPVTIRRY